MGAEPVINWLSATVRTLCREVKELQKTLQDLKDVQATKRQDIDGEACPNTSPHFEWEPTATEYIPTWLRVGKRIFLSEHLDMDWQPIECHQQSMHFDLIDYDIEPQNLPKHQEKEHVKDEVEDELIQGVIDSQVPAFVRVQQKESALVKSAGSQPCREESHTSNWQQLPSVGTWFILDPGLEAIVSTTPCEQMLDERNPALDMEPTDSANQRDMTVQEFLSAVASTRHRLPHIPTLDPPLLQLKNMSEQDVAGQTFLQCVRRERPHLEQIINQCVEPAWRGGQNQAADLMIDLLQMYRRSYQSRDRICDDADLLWLLDQRIRLGTDPHGLIQELRASRRGLLKEMSPKRKKHARK